MPPPLLNIKNFIRLDGMQNLVLPNELYVNCYGYVKTPLLTDSSNKIATTEWVKQTALSLAGFTTTNLAEGNNLYWTDARFDTRFGYKSTSDLQEGVNLYYTNARVAAYLLANDYATKGYVNTAVTNLVNGAPAVLDTLKELADALGSDPNFATSTINLINTKEPTITAGTTSQYWRGDKTWQTLPTYSLSGLGGVPTTRTLTINGSALDLSADRSWTIDSMVYPSAGIALSTGIGWGTSIANNSANWNTAFGWGNHASAGYVPYTGATTGLNMGNNPITTSNFFFGKAIELDAGVEEVGGSIIFRQRAATSGGGANYTTFSAVGNNILSYGFWQDAPSGINRYKFFSFRVDNITIGTNRIYQMPDASGTIALTSDIVSGYVPYTGATNNLNLGAYKLTTSSPFIDNVGSGGSLNFKIYNASDDHALNNNDYFSFYPLAGYYAIFSFNNAGVRKRFLFHTGNLAPDTPRYYGMPNADGTFALTSDLTVHELLSNKSTNTSLGTSNTLYPTQLAVKTYVDNAVTGGINIQGDWNASTNTPNISTTTTTGYTWRVSVAGTTNLGGITVWNVNDLAVKTASGWIKIDNSSTVQSVFGRQGVVVATTGDYTTAQVTEDLSYLYFTTARARAAFSAGTNITITDGVIANTYSYSLPIATASVLGGVKIGAGVTITSGVISVSTNYEAPIAAGTTTQYWRGDKSWQTLPIYTLPIASATVLGGIKVGTNLSIDANGVLSSTDTNTTYVNFTRTASGLVPNPGAATTNRYLREDGTWVIPPDTDTVYTHPTTAGNKHIPAGGATGQILRWSADGTAGWGADADTWNANSKDVAGYVSAPGAVANKVWKTDALGNPGWRDDADTDTNTWNANSKDVAGYVSAPGAVANKVWKTDASGNPGWRDDADTDTNTTYTAGTGLTLTGTSFSVTKTITASETADTIALRNGSGQLVATGFYQASSRELKTNITPFTRSALDIIRDVTIVSFNYKTDVINKHIGFIAEDTPEELSTRQQNVMDSNNTIGVLLKAIQELENRIKILESK